MPRHENVPRRVDVPVMPGATLTARPLPYSESCPTSRTAGGNRPAARTGPGRIVFRDHRAPNTGVLALVLEHPAQQGPAAVIHRLGEPRLADSGRPDVANHNLRAPIHSGPSPLVKSVPALILHLRVQGADAVLLSGPGGSAHGVLRPPVPAAMFQAVTVRGHGKVLEPEVDADRVTDVARFRLDRNLDTEVPAAPSVLDKGASTKREGIKAIGIPDAELQTGEPHCISGPLGRPTLERDPTQGTTLPATAAPAEAGFARGVAPGRVLITKLVDGRRADQRKLGTGPTHERCEIEAGKKAPFATEDFNLVSVASVPDCVDLQGHTAENSNVTILDPDLQGLHQHLGRAATTHSVSIEDSRHTAGRFFLPAVNGGVSESSYLMMSSIRFSRRRRALETAPGPGPSSETRPVGREYPAPAAPRQHPAAAPVHNRTPGPGPANLRRRVSRARTRAGARRRARRRRARSCVTVTTCMHGCTFAFFTPARVPVLLFFASAA